MIVQETILDQDKIEMNVLVPEIKFWDSFILIGLSVTEFLESCEKENLSVKSIHIDAGEVTRATVTRRI